MLYDGIFNYEKYREFLTVVNGLFGMYDENGKLVSKEEVMLSVNDDSPNFAVGDATYRELKNAAGISRVLSWIRNNKGSVRFVIPRYGKADFDITLPTMQSHKKPTNKK